MSRSPLEANPGKSPTAYLRNWDQLGTLISQGHSFSGRERNCCFLNPGQPSDDEIQPFTDVSAAVHLDDVADSRGVAACDWDDDGDLDLWVTTRTAPGIRFFRNELKSKNDSISLKLRGRNCNRDAIGARVSAKLKRLTDQHTMSLNQTVRAGDAFVSQSTRWIHFAAPKNYAVERVAVRWPGETTPEGFTGCTSSGRYTLRQGTGIARRVPTDVDRTAKLRPTQLELPKPTDKARIVLTRRRKLPPIEYVDLHGARHAVRPSGQGPTLVNLWASWCSPCVAELSHLNSSYSDLREKQLTIYALSIDGADDSSSTRKAAELVTELDLPFSAGVGGQSLRSKMRAFHSTIFYNDKPLPVPTSFLVDRRGAVVVIYRGPVEVQQLIQDISLIESFDVNRVTEALYPLGGRSGIGILPTDRLGFARAYVEGEYYEDAKRELLNFVEGQSSRQLDSKQRSTLAAARHLLKKIEGQLERNRNRQTGEGNARSSDELTSGSALDP